MILLYCVCGAFEIIFELVLENGFQKNLENYFLKDLKRYAEFCNTLEMIFEMVFQKEIWKRKVWFAKILKNDFS